MNEIKGLEISDDEKIAMTVPVINQGNDTERTIAFVMPSKYTFETIPQPNGDQVTLREVPERKVAALTYTWYSSEKRVEKYQERLASKLAEDGLTVSGPFSSAYYNPPLSMPLLLRNEILVEIE